MPQKGVPNEKPSCRGRSGRRPHFFVCSTGRGGSLGKSFNPKSAKKIADGLVKEVPKQMEKDGLLPKKVSSN